MALSLSQVEAIFGRFSFRELPSGLVAPQPEWLARAIVALRAPFPLPTRTGPVEALRCHRLIAARLLSALAELEKKGLRSLIHSFDGCYVPRHVRWDARKPLSRHTWGIALDLNAAEFPFGSSRKQHPQLVEALARNGFRCGQKDGGLWQKTLDPMHFEFIERSALSDAEQRTEDAERLSTLNSQLSTVNSDIPDVRIVIPGLPRPLAGTLEGGRLYGPVREIAEALGAAVIWDSSRKTAIITKGLPPLSH